MERATKYLVKWRRSLAVLLSICMVITMIPVSERAQAAEGVTEAYGAAGSDDTSDTGGSVYVRPEKGDGSEDNPYQIENRGNLYWFAGLVNGDSTICTGNVIDGGVVQNKSACAILVNDIVVNEGTNSEGRSVKDCAGVKADDWMEWTPVGDGYSGTFDGNGHTISGLYVNKADEWSVGMFRALMCGKVKSLGLINSYIEGADEVGAIAGKVYADSSISNCYNMGTIKVTSVAGSYIGGICGYITDESVRVNSCYNTGSLIFKENEAFCGGIAGQNRGGEITDCYALSNGTYTAMTGYGTDAVQSAVVSQDDFLTGKICYLLNDNGKESTWRQNLTGDSIDEYPVLSDTHSGVYLSAPCNSVYSNEPDKFVGHSYGEDGMCTRCGIYDIPECIDGVYQIGNDGQLYWFAGLVNGDSSICSDGISQNAAADAVLVNDIVINEGNVSGCDGVKAEGWREWTPIGNTDDGYTGTFDGSGHTISGLYVKKNEENVGLFGTLTGGAVVKSLGLTNSYVEGIFKVGGIAGRISTGGSINNCYNMGTIKSATGDNSRIGGICGLVNGSDTGSNKIISCYNTGIIICEGDGYTGGIAGINYGEVTDCYALSNDTYTSIIGYGFDAEQSAVVSQADFAGGKVCYLLNSGGKGNIWRQNLMADEVTGDTDEYPVPDDTHSRVYVSSPCKSVYSNEADKSVEHTYDADGKCTGCGIYDAPECVDGVYQIGNAYQLYWFAGLVNGDTSVCNGEISQDASADAVLVNDIVINEGNVSDCAGVKAEGWREWTPIGNYKNNNIYSGTFDGNGYTISGLYIKDPYVFNIGIFGKLMGGTVKSLGLINSYIEGYDYVGGIAGTIDGSSIISNCYNAGTVSSAANSIQNYGGICGYISGIDSKVTDCYNTGKVNRKSDNNKIGGIVGWNNGEVTDCYILDNDTYTSAAGGGYGTVESTMVSVDDFTSGKVCYLMNGEGKEDTWRQNLTGDSIDAYPVLNNEHSLVYLSSPCSIVYSNEPDKNVEHTYGADGKCTGCGTYKTPECVDGVYQIENDYQLYWFAGLVNGDASVCKGKISQDTSADAVLVNDIVLNEGDVSGCNGVKAEGWTEWTPIGQNNSNSYKGVFDGNGHTVSGLYYSNNRGSNIGLFGYVKGAVIKRVGVINSYVCAYDYAGIVCGSLDNSVLEDCYSRDAAVYSPYSGVAYIGGICGYSNGGTIKSCYYTGSVKGTDSNKSVGAICGRYTHLGDDCIKDCYALKADNISGVGNSGSGHVVVHMVLKDVFLSGEAAYGLNAGRTGDGAVWRQNLPGDEYPVTDNTHAIVYATSPCITYSNSEDNVRLEHTYEDGICTTCLLPEDMPEVINGVYQIDSADDLFWFAGLVNGDSSVCRGRIIQDNSAKAVLTCDIVINDGNVAGCGGAKADGWKEWVPIGNVKSAFAGELDGDGHTISGLYVNNPKAAYAGLSGVMTAPGTIHGVGITNSYISGKLYAGGICARVNDSQNRPVAIINDCYVSDSVIAVTSSIAVTYAGGICGSFGDGDMYNCLSTAKVYGASDSGYIGGVCGGAGQVWMVECYALEAPEYEAGIGYCSNGNTYEDILVTEKELESGKLCYGFNSFSERHSGAEGIWYQNLSGDNRDMQPVFDRSHEKVYMAEPCNVYTNIENMVKEHSFDKDGICSVCGVYKQPECIDGAYQIRTAGDLFWYAGYINYDTDITGNSYVDYNTKNAVLVNDIVINEGNVSDCQGVKAPEWKEWAPIGGSSSSYYSIFRGTFEGNGHTISGLYCNSSSISSAGLFGNTEDAVISGVGIVNSYISSAGYVGAIAGKCENGSITNCYNEGSISVNTGYSEEKVLGGICGLAVRTDIKGCYNTGNVKAASSKIISGGICGKKSDSKIKGCVTLKKKYSTTATGNSADGKVMTKEQFASGAVCYELNKGNGENVWRQNLTGEAKDEKPVLDESHGQVYEGSGCRGVFFNEPGMTSEHQFDDGICKVCGEYESIPELDEAGYYHIKNKTDLFWFAGLVNGDASVCTGETKLNIRACAVLDADIVVNTGDVAGCNGKKEEDWIQWEPIGAYGYNGTFNGNGHTISGIYVNNVSYAGLFGHVFDTDDGNAVICNLGIINSYFEGDAVAGSIAAYCRGADIANCYNMGTVVETSADGYAGGLAGLMGNVNAVNSYNAGTVKNVSGNKGYIGGIYGGLTDLVEFADCFCIKGSNMTDGQLIDGITYITDAQLESGEVCYRLNCGNTGEDVVWRQNLEGDLTDAYPVLDNTHKQVYKSNICTGVFSNNADAEAEHEYEDGLCIRCGHIEQAPESIDGIYQITNAGELYWFAGLVNGDADVCGKDVVQNTSADAVLVNDITVNRGSLSSKPVGARGWKPVGYDTDGYQGQFDGQGYSISGLYNNCSSTGDGYNVFALFGSISEEGSVTDVNLKNAYCTGAGVAGGICVENYGVISGCTYDGEILAGSDTDDGGTAFLNAGICAYNNGMVTNCINYGKIKADYITDSTSGGICAVNTGSVKNCINNGRVQSICNTAVSGGICGVNNGRIIHSTNNGNVSAEHVDIMRGKTSLYSGGIAGVNLSGVLYCVNTGSITGSANVGGVSGYCGHDYGNFDRNDVVIAFSYNTGSVKGDDYTGGFCGYIDDDTSVFNCYTMCNVPGSSWDNAGASIGEFAGYCGDVMIEGCCYNNSIYGNRAVGNMDISSDCITGMSAEEFADGKCALLLLYYMDNTIDRNAILSTYGITKKEASGWGQTIGTDPAPCFTGKKVYGRLMYSGCCEYNAGDMTAVLSASNDSKEAGSTYRNSKHAITADADTHEIKISCDICGSDLGAYQLKAPEGNMEYDGSPKPAVVTGSSIVVDKPDIVYSDSEGSLLETEPVSAGAYTASITVKDSVENGYTVSVNYSIVKAKTTPTVPDSAYNVDYKTDTIGSIILPEGWIWLYADTLKTIPYGESITVTAVYNGSDKGNYENESIQITVTRGACPHKETEIRNAVEAAPGAGGYTGDTYCKECGEKLAEGRDIPALPTPTPVPTATPTPEPTAAPTKNPSATATPTAAPTKNPSATATPTTEPSTKPSAVPTAEPSAKPSAAPTTEPSVKPSAAPTTEPGVNPSVAPTAEPGTKPSAVPTAEPSVKPSAAPTAEPGTKPSVAPTATPTQMPGETPSATPAVEPTRAPLAEGMAGKIVLNDATFWDRLLSVITFGQYELPKPTVEIISNVDGSSIEYIVVTDGKAEAMTKEELDAVTVWNVYEDKIVLESEKNVVYVKITDTEYGYVYYLSTDGITVKPDVTPSVTPSATPSTTPSVAPTAKPSGAPTATPSAAPTAKPSGAPTATPSAAPTAKPSVAPTTTPSATPTATPSTTPSAAPTATPGAKPGTEATTAPAAQDPHVPADNSNSAAPKKTGTKFRDSTGAVYKVTVSDKTNPEVMYYQYKGKADKVNVPDTVISDGVTYKVTALGKNAFKGCKKIKHITVGSNIAKLGKAIFTKCTKLKGIEFKTGRLTKKSIAAGAFKGVSKKVIIKVPKDMKKNYIKFFRAKGLGKKVKVK